MTVVDSLVWIDHLNGRAGPEVALLRRALDDPTATIIVGDLVLFEVLAGLRSPRMAEEVRELLSSLEVVSMVGPDLATRAAEHFMRLRSLGITPRTVHLLITTYCVAMDEALLTRDRDFDHLAAPLGNASLGMIGRLLGVSTVSVLRWVREETLSLPEPTTPAEIKIVQLDEMWHFVDGKNKCRVWKAFDPLDGRTLAWLLGPGFRVGATMRPASSSSPRSEARAASS